MLMNGYADAVWKFQFDGLFAKRYVRCFGRADAAVIWMLYANTARRPSENPLEGFQTASLVSTTAVG